MGYTSRLGLADMLGLAIGIVLVCLVVSPTMAQPVRYALEADKSSVGFIYQFNGNPTKGTMPVVKADIMLDFGTLSASTVQISLNAKRARAGFIFATEALRAKNVLDVARHPHIRFVSTKISRGGKGAKLVGMVTIRGVSRPLTLSAQFFRPKGAAAGDKSLLSILLTGSILRSEFGATGYPKLVGDRIDLKILARIRLVDQGQKRLHSVDKGQDCAKASC